MEKLSISDLIKDLELLYDISKYPCYNKLGKNREQMRKKLKKMIDNLKDGKYEKIFQKDAIDQFFEGEDK